MDHKTPHAGLIERSGKLYIIFLALLAAVPPIATDMYLGAMPTIAKQWHVGENIVGLSLVLWFVSFSVFLLISGPLSDKFGRKPVLINGLRIFVISCILCATASNVWQLIIYRILQGIGAAAPSAMCMAICRDRYDGERRKRALAYVGAILAIAPMIAPTIGVTLLKLGSWRFIFATQSVLGLITMLISISYRETIAEKVRGSSFAVMGRYVNLARNRGYILAVTSMGLIVGPHYGFIAFSSIAYIKFFGLSPSAFGLLFGLNGFMAMLGAFSCARLTKHLHDVRLLTLCICGCITGALGIVLFGSAHYLAFAVCMSAFTFSCGVSRPLSNNLILSQVDTDIGSASSLIVFYQFMVGAICMSISTTAWSHPILAFGILACALPLIVLAIWPILLRIIRMHSCLF